MSVISSDGRKLSSPESIFVPFSGLSIGASSTYLNMLHSSSSSYWSSSNVKDGLIMRKGASKSETSSFGEALAANRGFGSLNGKSGC